jgi:hypothetical protein
MSRKITVVTTAAALALAGSAYILGTHHASASSGSPSAAADTRHAGPAHRTVAAIPKGPPLYPGYADSEEGNSPGLGCWNFFIAPHLGPGGTLTGTATMTFVGPNNRNVLVTTKTNLWGKTYKNKTVDPYAFYYVKGSLTGHLAGGSTATGTPVTMTLTFPTTRIPYRNAASTRGGHALKLTGSLQPMANISGPGEFDMTDANQNVLAFWTTSKATFQTTLQQNGCYPPNYPLYHH